MSTTFGIKVKECPEGYDEDDCEEEMYEEIAFRSSFIRWTNPIAHLLPDELEVEPMDNTAQDIYTIGDIKKAILLQDKKLK